MSDRLLPTRWIDYCWYGIGRNSVISCNALRQVVIRAIGSMIDLFFSVNQVNFRLESGLRLELVTASHTDYLLWRKDRDFFLDLIQAAFEGQVHEGCREVELQPS